MKRTALLLLLAAPQIAVADPESPLAIDQDTKLGLRVLYDWGRLPRAPGAAEGERWSRASVVASYRSAIGGASSATSLGAQIGLEYELHLGATPEAYEYPGVERPPLELGGSMGPTLTIYTFDVPAPGMIVVRLAAEAELGGGHWWSNQPRLGPAASLRLALGVPNGFHLETEYELVPYLIGATFDGRKMVHSEHRFSLSLGYGPFGISADLGLADDLVHLGGGLFAPGDRAQSFSLGGALFWRR